MDFYFTVPKVSTWNQAIKDYTLQNTTTFQQSQIQLAVFDVNWKPISLSNLACTVTINQATGTGKVAVTPAGWAQVVNGQGYYWVIEATSYDKPAEGVPVCYWSSPKLVNTMPIQVVSFAAASSNSLELEYDIQPPAGGWPANNGQFTIPAFHVNVYAVGDGNFSDPMNSLNEVASYAVNNSMRSKPLTGTASDYELNLLLAASQINPRIMDGVANGYLLAQIVFDGPQWSDFSIPVRFQGGPFQTSDGQVWVYGGASFQQPSPQSEDYTNYMRITSGGNSVTVNEIVDDADWTAVYSEAFSTIAMKTTVNVFSGDGDTMIDGAGITDPTISIVAFAGNGNDIFQGGAGDDAFYGGSGYDIYYSSLGTDTFNEGGPDSSNLFVFGPTFSGCCSIGGTGLPMSWCNPRWRRTEAEGPWFVWPTGPNSVCQ